MAFVIQQMALGLTVGAIYSLAGLGLTLLFRTTGVVNLAQGEVMMIGAFIGMSALATLNGSLLLALLAVALVTGFLGLLTYFLIYRPLASRPVVQMIMATVAMSMILRIVGYLGWGASAYRFPAIFGEGAVRLGSIRITTQSLWVFVLATLVMVILHIFLTRTSMGTALRASAQDPIAATLIGIEAERMSLVAFCSSFALGGLGGVLYAPLTYVVFDMGLLLGLKGFTAAAIGGMGSIPGAIIGGFLLGIIEQVSAAYLSSQYRDVIAFTLLMVILVARPTGILRQGVVKL